MMDSENVRDMGDKNNPGMFQQRSQVQTTRRIPWLLWSEYVQKRQLRLECPLFTHHHPHRFTHFDLPSLQSMLNPLPKPPENLYPIASPSLEPTLFSKTPSPPAFFSHHDTTYHGSSTTGAHSPFFPVWLLTRALLIKCPSRRTVLLSRHGNSNPTNIAGR